MEILVELWYNANRNMDRRSFLVGSASLAGTMGVRAAVLPSPGPVRLRIGVLSDIHVDVEDGEAISRWERALREFDAWKADGVLVCGDLADWGLDCELEWVAKTWFKVFPGNRRSDGAPVANLLHYGDHDTSGYTYRGCPPCAKAWPDEAEMKKRIIPLNDRKAIWERCFREPWAPIVHKKVKGYDFVLSHFTKGEKGNEAGDNVPGLAEFLAAKKFDPARPFFYSQHRVPFFTAGGPFVWGQDDGTVSRLFNAKYPNAIAFCGHAHLTAGEEQSIWQGGFTCIEVPSLNYSVTLGGRENGFSLTDMPYAKPCPAMPAAPCGVRSQGYFVTVCDRAMVVRRWNFLDGGVVGPDWTVPLGPGRGKPYARDVRREREAAPEFAEGAKITFGKACGKDRMGNEHDFVTVGFPIAEATATTPRANDYEVRLNVLRGDVALTVSTRRVFSPGYGRALSVDKGPVVCNFPVEDIPGGGQRIGFEVRPVNSFGRFGTPIAARYKAT